jgi:hypothetical protein
MPVLFGIDAESLNMARRYAIDHNNLTMAGGDFTVFDMEKMWDRDAYLNILDSLSEDGDMPVTVDFDDFSVMKNIGFEFENYENVDSDTTEEEEELTEETLVQVIVTVTTKEIAKELKSMIIEILDSNPEWESNVIIKD